MTAQPLLPSHDGTIVPLRLNELNYLELDVTLDGLPSTFIIDTGANATTLHYGFALANGLALEPTDEKGGGVGDRQMKVHTGIVRRFSAGSFEVNDQKLYYMDMSHVLAAFKEKANLTHITGVLGGDFLRKHAAVIDYGGKQLWLR